MGHALLKTVKALEAAIDAGEVDLELATALLEEENAKGAKARSTAVGALAELVTKLGGDLDVDTDTDTDPDTDTDTDGRDPLPPASSPACPSCGSLGRFLAQPGVYKCSDCSVILTAALKVRVAVPGRIKVERNTRWITLSPRDVFAGYMAQLLWFEHPDKIEVLA